MKKDYEKPKYNTLEFTSLNAINFVCINLYLLK